MKVLIAAVNKEMHPDPVFPIGASYIAYHTKKAGHNVSIFDACFNDDPEGSLKRSLIENDPDVIAFSIRNVDNNAFPVAVNYLDYYKKLVDVCRANSKAKLVLGGSGFSIFPELFMNELKPDHGIKGEGENEFLELLKKIENNDKIENKLTYPSKIKDIDINEFPDRSGFDVDKYFKYSGCMNIQTKRGCAFICSYCTYPVLEGNQYRFRSPSKVVDEIEFWYNEKGMNYFFFVDNVFNHPEDYAEKICNEIIKRKLKIKWTGFFIPKLNNESFVDACIESGCSSMDFGTDAFSPETLKGFSKHFTVDDIFKACEICTKKDMKFNHSLIFGGPNETRKTLDETIKNVCATKPTSVIGFIGVRLYAGTPIANSIKDINIGIDPVFYISEDVKEFLVDYLKEVVEDKKNWVVPGLEKGTDLVFLNKLRKKGIKGPLWEMFSKLDYLDPGIRK